MSIASDTGKIHVLPGAVVSRIAAGEVVERPAAVVKELIDNSLDAGGTRISVDVTDGGRTLIQVIDDGEGMSPSDALVAFQRHATSKLRTEEDLSSIATMGFRGEALPSIGSVSKIRLVTRCRQEAVGMRLVLAGGRLIQQEETAASPGTQVEVRDLFFNTPARKKFLKTSATEFSHICQAVQQTALAWPAVSFRLKHNGHSVLDYPAPASPHDRLLQVYGPSFMERTTAVRAEGSGIHVHGVTVQALHARAGRVPQELFVNRRPVKNAAVLHAVYDGYGVSLRKGTHPTFVLFLEIDPALVDVNVHPTKREVRFSNQEAVHETVRRAIRASVEGESVERGSRVDYGSWGWDRRAAGSGQESECILPDRTDSGNHKQRMSAAAMHEATAAYLLTSASNVIPFGQIARTFLVAQVNSELQVIDQHTAHERVLFERLCRAWQEQSVPSQPLLIPESIEMAPHEVMLLEQHLSDLAKVSLDVEPFGGGAVLIRGVPAVLTQVDYPGLLRDLLEELAQRRSAASLDEKVRAMMATVACHGAVRAGRTLMLPEIKQLIEEWVGEGLPATCPHGRRIALRLPTEELAKTFGR